MLIGEQGNPKFLTYYILMEQTLLSHQNHTLKPTDDRSIGMKSDQGKELYGLAWEDSAWEGCTWVWG
jgi:hypothetical protein